MRQYLAFTLLLACMAVSSASMAGSFSGLVQKHFDNNPAIQNNLTLIQFRGRENRRARVISQRRNLKINRRVRPVPGSIVRPRPGIRRAGQGRAAIQPGYGAARDIGAGAAVQTARRSAAGEVLGVRRTGSVYNVKVLDRGRVRIVTIDAYSGNVLNIK